jgi:DUF917 family protein
MDHLASLGSRDLSLKSSRYTPASREISQRISQPYRTADLISQAINRLGTEGLHTSEQQVNTMTERMLSKDDLNNMLVGVGILGTGGGGDPETFGRLLIQWDINKGREYRIIDPKEINDDAFVMSGGYGGSVKSVVSLQERFENWESRFELLDAMRIMESIKERKVDYVVPFELGGINTPVVLSLAARAGIVTVDGDGLGRAAPETQMSSFLGHGISLTPMPFVDIEGNVIVVNHAVKPTYPDQMMRAAIVLNGRSGANAHYPMSGKQLKESVIPNTISQSIEIGRAVSEAMDRKRDPVEAFIEAVHGTEIFRGAIRTMRGEERGAFYHVRAVVKGVDRYQKRTMEVVFKNETMMARVNKKLVSVFPDLLCMLDPRSGRGVMTANLRPGKRVVFVGVPAHERLRECLKTELGQEAFAAARYGYPKVKYRPIETLNR